MSAPGAAPALLVKPRAAAAQPAGGFKAVQPILQRSCLSCHGNGKERGKFNLDTRENLLAGGKSGPAVVPGDSAKSLLIALVRGDDPKKLMPKKGDRLTAGEVGALQKWIDGGVDWPKGFSFARGNQAPLEPRQVEMPAGVDARVFPNPIDRILQPYYAAHGEQAGAIVDDRTFARRAWLDLVGLLPPPAELQAFVNDHTVGKRQKLVQRLLDDDNAYAAHWLTFWNDALRNDYAGAGYIDGGRKQITEWLYRALATNMPYDRFVRELVSAAPGTEGFTNGIVWRGVVNASQVPPMQAAQNVAQVFMGVNLKCASCHDSFINHWKLDDSYGLAGVFADGPLEMARCDKPLGRQATAKFLYGELGAIDPSAPRAQRMAQLAQAITDQRNGRLTRTIVNRLWQKLMGRGLIEPADDMDGDPWSQDLLDWLAADLSANHYDLKKTIERIVTSRAYQARAVGAVEDVKRGFVFHGPLVKRMSAEEFVDAVAMVTGTPPGKIAVRTPKAPPPRRAKAAQRNNVVPPEAVDEPRASLCLANPLMTALGRPNREQVVTERTSAATTLQALELTNGQTLDSMLKTGAATMVEQRPSPAGLVQDLYQRALGRSPSRTELETAVEAVGSPPRAEGVADLLWAIMMQPEFQLIR